MATYIDLGGVRTWYDELGDGEPVVLRIRAPALPKSDTAQRQVSRRSSVLNERDRPTQMAGCPSLQSVLVVEHGGVGDPDDRALR